ncbi:EF-hand domain-containing protein [Pseudoscourfieldia marina]
MARENPPTPEKNGKDPIHTPGSASTVARRVSFFGREMMLDAPAESTPNTPALLKQIRESGVSPMLTLLTDTQLKDPGIAADAVRSLTPAALATVGLRNADGERGRQKRRRETDPAPRGTGALPPPPARKYAAKAEDIDTFSDDEEDDEEHDPSDEPFVVKLTTFPLAALASSMKLNVEPVVAGYAWSNALCAVTAGLSVDSDRNRDYSLLVDYTALRPLANPLHLQELLPMLPPKAHVFVGNDGEARVLLHLRIEVLELLAAAAAYYTFAHLLPPDRIIVHFIDSQVAFAWVAKGYASQLHVADIVNKLHLDHLHRQVWFEWLDSDANIADIPSRGDPDDPALAGDYAILRELGATRITAKLPPIPPSYYAAADTP